jgi:hypothetical protein
MLLVGANHPLMIVARGRKLAQKAPKFSFGERFPAAFGKYFQRNYLQLASNRPLQLRTPEAPAREQEVARRSRPNEFLGKFGADCQRNPPPD